MKKKTTTFDFLCEYCDTENNKCGGDFDGEVFNEIIAKFIDNNKLQTKFIKYLKEEARRQDEYEKSLENSDE